jgi:hypothetical protein
LEAELHRSALCQHQLGALYDVHDGDLDAHHLHLLAPGDGLPVFGVPSQPEPLQ